MEFEKMIAERVRERLDEVAAEIARDVLKEFQKLVGPAIGLAPPIFAAQRITQCVAPGCTNKAKGPRNRYCCDVHKNAPKEKQAAWMKAYLARRRSEESLSCPSSPSKPSTKSRKKPATH